MKTPRELVGEMYQYTGWTPETLRAHSEMRLEQIQRQVRMRRCDGVMSKSVIRGILGQVRLTSNFEALNWLQTELEHGIVAFSEDAYEERRCYVASLFTWFVWAECPVTDGIVDTFYQLLGSSFDDLNGGTYVY